MDERTDIELVTLAREGDKNAFGLLVQRYQMLARRFAMRLVVNKDCAQELAQEAMLQAYLSLDNLRDPERFKSWLCGIVLNVCRGYLRAWRVSYFSLESVAGGLQFDAVPISGKIAGPQEIAEEQELHRIVLDAVKTLPSKDQDITLMFYYEQLNLQEIAVILGISVGAVKVRLHRARQRLKGKLLLQQAEIIPYQKRREKMIKVTIADVVKQERVDDQGRSHALYVIMLEDETGQRVLPIWIGLFEGQSIATGLSEFSTQRPMTYNFFTNILQAIDAWVEEVRIEKLEGYTFYATVKVRCGDVVKEVDARPSDALALAVRTGSPIFVTEDILESVGADIPQATGVSPLGSGVENILSEIRDIQTIEGHQLSQEE
ncbi:bifunctional nuclease domain-containing protein, partial [Chloroflexota bacterium]